MQRAAIAVSIALVMLAASAVVTNHPNANVVQERDNAVLQPAGSVFALGPAPFELAAVEPAALQPASLDRADTVSADESQPETSALREPATEDLAEPARTASMEEICATLQSVAAAHELPVPFFARLIWQESRFRSDAVSHAGARGIAQFMPATARERGLSNPHDPIESLRHSAHFLRALRNQFGNLGLAAAAYNGGPGRVQAWLKGRKTLPRETRNYVQIITGAPVEEWKDRHIAAVVQVKQIPARVPCPVLVAAAAQEEPVTIVELARAAASQVRRASRPNVHVAGWSVVLAGSYSKERAQAQSAKLQRRFSAVLNGRTPTIVSGRVAGRGKSRLSQVSIPENDRASAERLCARLRAGGASCAVMRAS